MNSLEKNEKSDELKPTEIAESTTDLGSSKCNNEELFLEAGENKSTECISKESYSEDFGFEVLAIPPPTAATLVVASLSGNMLPVTENVSDALTSKTKSTTFDNTTPNQGGQSLATEARAAADAAIYDIATHTTTQAHQKSNSETTVTCNPFVTEKAMASANDSITTPLSMLTSPTLTGPHLPHIASEPTFGIQLRRNQDQRNLKHYHEAQNPIVWWVDSNTSGNAIMKTGTISAFTSPSITRKSLDTTNFLTRRVSFPKSDNELVTGYLEPANPWEHVCMVKSISEIAELYVISCQKHNTKPLQTILDHLKVVEINKQIRQPLLSLKAIKLMPSDCEALEEVFKRVQYKTIDLSSCDLDETAASALFEMIEYYEATNELDISSNSKGMTHRGWVSCTYMVSHSQALHVLNAEGNPISKSGAENLGHALSTSNLHTIKLEHCGMKGAPLSGLCFKLRHNRVLKELWLAHNDLDCHDADAIADLLKVNHYLELVDISNNNIRDEGLRHIVKALIIQSRELERRSMLQRSAAIDDDNSLSPLESSSGDLDISDNMSCSKDAEFDSVQSSSGMTLNNAITIEEGSGYDTYDVMRKIMEIKEPDGSKDALPPSLATANLMADENDIEEDTEDTVKSSTLKTSQQTAGQSMLDKLLSMNSDSSSDDGGSNISTDTIAACCSEDTSIISDDIFETLTAGSTNVSINTKSTSMSASTPPGIEAGANSISNRMAADCAKQETMENKSNLCDISLSEATSGESNSETNNSSGISTSSASLNSSLNTSKSGHHHTYDTLKPSLHTTSEVIALPTSEVFEVTADESDCVISGTSSEQANDLHGLVLQHPTKALDVNKGTKLVEDYEDTHSTDSAFESASEGDISRHLPEEFSRLSSSFESTRLDEIAKELVIETATIATESTESLVEVVATPTSTPTPPTPPLATLPMQQVEDTTTCCSTPLCSITAMTTAVVGPSIKAHEKLEDVLPVLPKVTIAEHFSNKEKESTKNPNPTPPPPSTSPGSLSMRRSESSCAFITQSTRNRSQSSDSLCSDNSLDSSISSDLNFSTSAQLNEKLTKNDTLTRQQRQFDPPADTCKRAPSGLKAFAVWNNNLTKEAGLYISDLLSETVSLELLNIGKNCLSNEFISRIKESVIKNTTLTTLGLQSAHLSAKGIETLSSVLTFGGNSTLRRIDIRDNKLEVDSLTTIAEVLKSNTTVTQIDIDDEPKRLSVGSDAHLDYARLLENVRSMCSRNEKTQTQLQAEKTATLEGINKRRVGYYMGSRKISLTCHSRPLIEPGVSAVSTSTNNKLDIKRKTGARLRSPVPSPPTISPSSSPNRSRFQVFRVVEVSPLTSPLAQTPPPQSPLTSVPFSCNVPIPTLSSTTIYQHKLTSTSLPTSSSLPSMATVTSSTQSIKRLSTSPRSRFHVSKIYEDPRVPLANRSLPPITSPIAPPPNPPSTPIARTTLETESAPQNQNIQTTLVEEFHNTNNSQTSKSDSTNVVTDTISLSPLYSSSSSSSSSSSTSPASMTSGSSSTSTSSSSSTTLANSIESFDNEGPSEDTLANSGSPKRCPIAVFTDNDITLTRNSIKDSISSAVVAVAASDTLNLPSNQEAESVEDAMSSQPTHLRARKMPWIGNPTAVDKLLTLFHSPVTIFQRSLSPEQKSAGMLTSMQGINKAESTSTLTSLPTQQDQPQYSNQNSVVSTRKHSPPSWSKLGTDILNANRPDTANTVVSTAAAATLEQSKSFLDAASRQFRDFSKQVFRQNLSFANDFNTSGAASDSAVGDCLSSGIGSSDIPAPEHITELIPTEVKQAIKENISPQHTINDETLHNLQKLSTASAPTSSGGVGNDADTHILPQDLEESNELTSNFEITESDRPAAAEDMPEQNI